jgi:REP element-mobilizing transposase RayT
MSDHVHMMLSIPPKHAVSQVVGYIKGEECHTFGAGVRRAQSAISSGRVFGPAGTLCQRWVGTRR